MFLTSNPNRHAKGRKGIYGRVAHTGHSSHRQGDCDGRDSKTKNALLFNIIIIWCKNDSNTEKYIKYTGKVGCVEVPDTHLFYYKEDFLKSNISKNLTIGNPKNFSKNTIIITLFSLNSLIIIKNGKLIIINFLIIIWYYNYSTKQLKYLIIKNKWLSINDINQLILKIHI